MSCLLQLSFYLLLGTIFNPYFLLASEREPETILEISVGNLKGKPRKKTPVLPADYPEQVRQQLEGLREAIQTCTAGVPTLHTTVHLQLSAEGTASFPKLTTPDQEGPLQCIQQLLAQQSWPKHPLPGKLVAFDFPVSKSS